MKKQVKPDTLKHRRWCARKKALGLCVGCGTRPHRPEKTLCQSCAEARVRQQRHRRETDPLQRAKEAAYRRLWRQRQIAEGRCGKCGTRRPRDGNNYCEVCIQIGVEAKRRARCGVDTVAYQTFF